jgi:hypothetical protein
MNPDAVSSSSPQSTEPAPAGAAAVPIGAPAGVQSAPPSDPGSTPQAAADSDRIEQEWVVKTKQILLATRNDPYEQARQLAALRADYMMKRYSREIKLGE